MTDQENNVSVSLKECLINMLFTVFPQHPAVAGVLPARTGFSSCTPARLQWVLEVMYAWTLCLTSPHSFLVNIPIALSLNIPSLFHLPFCPDTSLICPFTRLLSHLTLFLDHFKFHIGFKPITFTLGDSQAKISNQDFSELQI